MKIIQINTTCGLGSTGKICVEISKLLTNENIENYILYSCKTSGYELGVKCSQKRYIKRQAIYSRVFGNYGFNSIKATKKLIKEIDKVKPDIVHIHNIHGHDCNLEILFDYFKMKKIKLIWTFHDCWVFTGYCTYFTLDKCSKWKKQCNNCVQYKNYSWLFDRSIWLYEKKKKIFSGLDLTIVTPSKWLGNLVKESFLKDYTVKVINNGIDLNIFTPTKNSIRELYNIPNEKKIILGVSFGWGKRKGLDVFIELAKYLDNEKYQIILVGTNQKVDKKLPSNIISIHKTSNQRALAELYTSADLFLNPTREENYPTVNMEAIACGTPVLTFRTGGSPEVIDENTGFVLECEDTSSIVKEITKLCNEKIFSKENCLIKAKEFSAKERFKEYIELYEALL